MQITTFCFLLFGVLIANGGAWAQSHSQDRALPSDFPALSTDLGLAQVPETGGPQGLWFTTHCGIGTSGAQFGGGISVAWPSRLILSLRMTHTIGVERVGYVTETFGRTRNDVGECAVMVGKLFKHGDVSFTANFGLALLLGETGRTAFAPQLFTQTAAVPDRYSSQRASAFAVAGLALEGEAFWQIGSVVGIGVRASANVNSVVSYGSFGPTLKIGVLP